VTRAEHCRRSHSVVLDFFSSLNIKCLVPNISPRGETPSRETIADGSDVTEDSPETIADGDQGMVVWQKLKLEKGVLL
jgi:hypothetical protein